jgi:hypothetical protein
VRRNPTEENLVLVAKKNKIHQWLIAWRLATEGIWKWSQVQAFRTHTIT